MPRGTRGGFRLAFDWLLADGEHTSADLLTAVCLGQCRTPFANAIVHDPRSSVADLEAGVVGRAPKRKGPGGEGLLSRAGNLLRRVVVSYRVFGLGCAGWVGSNPHFGDSSNSYFI